jgi:prepilin-type N-terminal cleavage/methylation domain-containing protein
MGQVAPPPLRFDAARDGGMKAVTPQADSRHVSRVTRRLAAFTLIELLTVMTIIGVLAAFLFPVVGGIKRQQYIRNAQAEMEQLETAIDRYKAAYGFYPPDNQHNPANPLVNQLYFELLGTTNTGGSSPVFQSLDDPTIHPTQSDLATIFGVSGIMNCSKTGSAEDVRAAQNFLPGLKPNQVSASITNGEPDGFKMLVSSVGGPDLTYNPLNMSGMAGVNPWRYNSSNPTNNPGAYDLWVQLSIGGKTNLICNWNNKVQFNSPLP